MRFPACIWAMVFICETAFGQNVSMKEGKVYKDGAVYCHYKETGKRINTMTTEDRNPTNKLSFPEACNDAFRDYAFGGEHQTFITANARVLASAQEPYLVYHYSIKLEGLNRELNFLYNPLLIRTLAQDIVKYDVIQNGYLNEKNAQRLFDRWETKPNIISKDLLQQAVVSNYNSPTGQAPERAMSINIRIVGDKIYKDDSLFGQYILDKHLGDGNLFGSRKDRYCYKIEDPNGMHVGWVVVPMLRSCYFLLPAGEKESLAVVTTDRDEQKIIASAVKVLIVHKAAQKDYSNDIKY